MSDTLQFHLIKKHHRPLFLFTKNVVVADKCMLHCYMSDIGFITKNVQ